MKKIFIWLSILLMSMLFIGSFYDLEIAKFFFIKDNYFSFFFEHFAPVVFGTVLIIGGSLLFLTILSNKNYHLFNKILSGIIYVLFIFMGVFMCYNYVKIVGAIYGIVAVILIGFMSFKIPADLSKNYRLVGMAILLTAMCSMVFVEGLKLVFGRVRFRSMQENFGLFTNWYKVNGSTYLASVTLKEEIKSFPSGHSQWAGTTLTLSLIPLANPKWQSKEKMIFIVTVIYAFIVMLSRMMQGAHFLTDVTVGFSSAFVFFLIFRKWLVINYLKANNMLTTNE